MGLVCSLKMGKLWHRYENESILGKKKIINELNCFNLKLPYKSPVAGK